MDEPLPSCSPDGVDSARSCLGFSLTSPDLVVCAGSPDLPMTNQCGDYPVIGYSVELSLANGINGSDVEAIDKELSADSSFEPLPHLSKAEGLEKDCVFGISINAGCNDRSVVLDGLSFAEDCCFVDGESVRTDAVIGDGLREGLSLHQTARVGDFSYCFQALEPGDYVVCLHLAETVFTEGPVGIRVFDVFIQEEKVVSGLDIFAQVGANKPLVISGLRARVNGKEGLSIRFERVTGSPIVCGLSIVKDSSARNEEPQVLIPVGMAQRAEHWSTEKRRKRVRWQEGNEYEAESDYQKLLENYEHQKQELMDMRRAFEDLERENQLKSRECQDAWKSMRELQNELMRKSMHVGSLAFAIEGQVKEKSRWFTSLRDMTRKLKIMKMENIKLSEEASSEYNKSLAEIMEMRSTIEVRMKQQVDLHEDLKIKYIKGAKERKELYNKVLKLKGNIRVFCRCRPLNAEEVAAGASMAINLDSTKDGELTVTSNGISRKSFKFDAVFGPQADQADVFEETAPFAASVLDGYNVCIFAYGQTGTGKTFTMEGSEGARGVNFRTLEEVFNIIKERQHQIQYEVSVSVIEIYNEQIRDLLVSTSHQGAAAKRLEVRQVGEGQHHVPGLVDARVSNMTEAWEVLRTGSNARTISSTSANEHSSRSHCIHCVMVKGENLLNGECTRSKLWLVDLAGSERIAKTEVQGERLKETQNINRSLSALGDVIAALATGGPHIPFRNSKLTHLLQDSLGGDSKTLMFVQVSPNENDIGETLCSLNFASRARGIELGPPKRQLDAGELLKYKQMVEKTKQDLKIKDMHIKKMEETIHGFEMKLKEKDVKNKNLPEKVKELESQLLVERKLARQHVDARIAEQQRQQKQQREEQNSAPPKLPNANRLVLGSNKNFSEDVYGAVNQNDTIKPTKPLLENNSFKPAMALSSADNIFDHNIDPAEKENNPPELLQLPKKTGRASMYITAQQFPVASSAPRRNSLIPPPSMPRLSQVPVPLQSLQSASPLGQAQVREDAEEGSDPLCLPEQVHTDSPKGIRSATKKLSSASRRSLQKRAQPKSPVQHQLRKGGVNVGLERGRVSIGSRGRLPGTARRAVAKEAQKKSRREMEKGWNVGTLARTTI